MAEGKQLCVNPLWWYSGVITGGASFSHSAEWGVEIQHSETFSEENCIEIDVKVILFKDQSLSKGNRTKATRHRLV